jgi:3-phytase
MRSFQRLPAVAVAVAVLAVFPASIPAEAGPDPLPVVAARVETPPLFDDEAGGDADADDPAIWVNHRRPAASVVLGTAKDAGLRAYDLRGHELQAVDAPPAPAPGSERGRFNNVDLLTGVRLGGVERDLAIVTDRGRDQLRFYAVAGGRRPLTDVTAADVPFVFSADQADVDEQATAYGLAAWFDQDGTAYAVVSRRNTSTLALVRLVAGRDGTMSYERVRTLDMPSSFRLPDGTTWTPCGEPGEGPQFEGMVVDRATATLYAAQEDVGIWRLDANLDAGPGILVDRVGEYGVPAAYDEVTDECVVSGPDPGYGGENLAADAEGLTIAYDSHRGGRLLASSQGDSTFVIYDRVVGRDGGPNRVLGRFRVGSGARIDGVEDSDGAAVVTERVPGFPGGLLVLHDGAETPAVPGEDGEPRPATNFAYVAYRDVLRTVR